MCSSRSTSVLGFAAALGFLARATLADPPPVPKAFTREVVQELIAKVDVGYNAVLLKVPYLVSRRKHPFPHHEGLRMMREAVKSEEVGSKRWILLKSLYAFGTRQRGGFLDNKTYGQLFRSQLDRPNAQASRDVNVALVDFLTGLKSCPYPATIRSAQTAKTMELAAALYLVWPALRYRELDFGPALKKAEGVTAVRDALDKAASATLAGENGKTYVVLKRAGMLYKPWKPEAALALLQQAEPLLDREDTDEVERLYTHLVDALLALKRLDKALAAQEKLNDLTGRGQVRLLALREQAGQKGALGQGLAAMDYAQIGEKELYEFCNNLSRDRKYDEMVLALTHYLDASRRRDPGYELWARYRLAGILANRKKFEEAEKIAAASHLKPPFKTARARVYHRRLAKFAGRLSAQTGKK